MSLDALMQGLISAMCAMCYAFYQRSNHSSSGLESGLFVDSKVFAAKTVNCVPYANNGWFGICIFIKFSLTAVYCNQTHAP